MTSHDKAIGLQTVAGVPLGIFTQDSAARWIVNAAATGKSGAVHLVNAYTVALNDRDPVFRENLAGALVNLPDGMPLSVLGRIKNKDFGQVRGPRLFEDVLSLGRTVGIRHFLLGGTTDTLTLLVAAIGSRYKGAEVVGVYSPPFRTLSTLEIAVQDQTIRDSGAQIVWVGLGTPKQDYEVMRLAHAVPTLAIAVGAAFDFLSGNKREAPAIVTKLGLEWLFRFASEPRRLWRRYLVGNAQFLRAAFRARDTEGNRQEKT